MAPNACLRWLINVLSTISNVFFCIIRGNNSKARSRSINCLQFPYRNRNFQTSEALLKNQALGSVLFTRTASCQRYQVKIRDRMPKRPEKGDGGAGDCRCLGKISSAWWICLQLFCCNSKQSSLKTLCSELCVNLTYLAYRRLQSTGLVAYFLLFAMTSWALRAKVGSQQMSILTYLWLLILWTINFLHCINSSICWGFWSFTELVYCISLSVRILNQYNTNINYSCNVCQCVAPLRVRYWAFFLTV